MNVKPAVIELDRSPMSLADISQCKRHVRFTPKSGHSPTRAACPLRAILLSLRASRLRQCSSDPMHAKGSGAIFRSIVHRFEVQPTLRPFQQPRSRPMTTRRAACSCGQLYLTIEGEPSRISMCHCLECQRRTGAVISNQARFRREQVTFSGKAIAWMRTAESGNAMTYHFCPTCGSTVYWEGEGFPEYVAVAIGNFADPNFPAPTIAVWEESRHPWVSLPTDTPPKRVAKQG